MESSKVKFRASGVGNLMVGSHGLTDAQASYLEELQSRHDRFVEQKQFFEDNEKRLLRAEMLLSELIENHDATEYIVSKDKTARKRILTARKRKLAGIRKQLEPSERPLTDNMQTTLQELIDKRDAPFEFGATARSFIRALWLQLEYGYRDLVFTNELLKGHLCEQDSIHLLDQVFPLKKGIRMKNKDRKENDFFTGHCDIHIKRHKVIEDVKTCWSLSTFDKVDSAPELYYAQGQAYMDLYGCDTFNLYYCLVNTPAEQVMEEEKRYWFKLGAPDEDNKLWIEVQEQLAKNHRYDHIPAELRVKVFRYERNDEYIAEMKRRVQYARELYKGFSLKL